MSSKSDFAIDARALARRFGSKWVLRGFSAQIAPGEIVALMGANGSGKTTLLRIFATLLKPSAGDARIFGRDVERDSDAVRGLVSYFSHTPGLYEDLTARENLRFAAKMSGIAQPPLEALLDMVGLSATADERVRGFSSGMQRRVALARMLLRPARLLLLDEPYNNLDAEGTELLNGVLRKAQADGSAAVIVLHETGPAAGILNRVIALESGRAAGSAGVSAAREAPARVGAVA